MILTVELTTGGLEKMQSHFKLKDFTLRIFSLASRGMVYHSEGKEDAPFGLLGCLYFTANGWIYGRRNIIRV